MQKVAEDKRGAIFEVGVVEDRHVNILVTKAGFYRGGHFHDYPEEFFVVWGELDWVELDWVELDWVEAPTPETNPGVLNSTRYTMGMVMNSQPGIPHMLKANTDCVVVEFRPAGAGFKATDFAPMRNLIKAQLA
jgi:hypothetical protein